MIYIVINNDVSTIIAADKKYPLTGKNSPLYFRRLKKVIVGVKNTSEEQSIIKSNKAKLIYFIKFGASDLMVSPIGLGCMSMSGTYGKQDDNECLATIRRAVDLGINFFDTSSNYGKGHNHMLIAKALKGLNREVNGFYIFIEDLYDLYMRIY